MNKAIKGLIVVAAVVGLVGCKDETNTTAPVAEQAPRQEVVQVQPTVQQAGICYGAAMIMYNRGENVDSVLQTTRAIERSFRVVADDFQHAHQYAMREYNGVNVTPEQRQDMLNYCQVRFGLK